MTIFDYLQPVQSDLLYRRKDPNDVRLGEVVQTDKSNYEVADIVLIGCPQDEGVKRNKGRIGASEAPDEIRKALYRLVAPDKLCLFDAGNTIIQSTLEATHTTHTGIVKQLIQDGKYVVSLGGGNDVSYADCSGLAQATESVFAINVDAHFDVRADEVRNSGTPYRQLLEEGFIQPQNFYEVGSLSMSNSITYRDYLLNKQAHIIDLDMLNQRGLNAVFQDILTNEAKAIFWGLDMDVVRAADAPGVSAVNSIGISGYDFAQIGTIAGRDSRSRIFEITEVNPAFDIDSRTARLAAATIHQFLSYITRTLNHDTND